MEIHPSLLFADSPTLPPPSWFFEKDGWTVGGIGEWIRPQSHPDLELNASVREQREKAQESVFFAIRDGKAWMLSKEQLEHAMDVARAQPNATDALMQQIEGMVAEPGFNRWPLPLARWKSFAKEDEADVDETFKAIGHALGPAFDIARTAGATTSHVIDWLNEGDLNRRTQALQAAPGVLVWLLQMSTGDRHAAERKNPHLSFLRELGEMIDRGQPWQEPLSDMLAKLWVTDLPKSDPLAQQIPKTILRGLQRIIRLPEKEKPSFQTLRTLWASRSTQNGVARITELLWKVGTMEAVDIPSTQFSKTPWLAMHVVTQNLFGHVYLPTLDLVAFSRYRLSLRGMIKRPEEWSDCDWLVSQDQMGEMQIARRSVYHWISSIILTDIPQDKLSESKDFVARGLSENLSFKQFLDASETLHRFHTQATQRASVRNAQRIRSLEQNPRVELWTAGGPATATHHGVKIRALQHPLELLKEGEEMSHCVAGYSDLCFQGTSRIFAFEHTQTNERATLEVRQQKSDHGKIEIIEQQFFSERNQQPSLTMKAANRQFLQQLNNENTMAIWPTLETPEEWAEKDNVLDDVFRHQVQAWFRAKHPSVAKAFFSHIATVISAQSNPTTPEPVARRAPAPR